MYSNLGLRLSPQFSGDSFRHRSGQRIKRGGIFHGALSNETDTALEGGRSMIPKLDFADAKLFYDLWIPLLDYVNRTYNVNPKLGKMTRADGLNIQEVRVVAFPSTTDCY